ncbi:hypothetical protein MMC29_000311, partial [Sticta canariensis]|nr:hypothetical protein [Sticta canariensis]
MYALNSGPHGNPRYRDGNAETLNEQVKSKLSMGLLNAMSACIEFLWFLGAMPAYIKPLGLLNNVSTCIYIPDVGNSASKFVDA